MGVAVEKSDLCIVGAGLAGLNALFVASKYLAAGQRVILVDRRQRVGGMWVDTYPYVRLHQPHPMFTAGNITWTLGQKPAHLAAKGEVLDHFDHCLRVIKDRLHVDEFFGWTLESHEESDDSVRVTFSSAAGEQMVVETNQLIKAYGFQVNPNDPLDVSSQRVHSVSPDTCDMRGAPISSTDTPVWIIGGGKTAMDTAHALISDSPGREVNLVAGSGTFFHNRDLFFPNGIRRWWGGTMTSTVASELADRYDGTNEEELWDWHRSKYGVKTTAQTGNFLLGFLSTAEADTISAGLDRVIMDHMVDVIDADDITRMILRTGDEMTVEPGSWIVNCTGYVVDRGHPYEPYISPGGRVLSIQTRSATMHLPSYMAYFLTHLMLSGKIRDIPLYEIDMFELAAKSRKSFPYALFALVQYNLSLCADVLPARVFQECGPDFDRWYPLPRRLLRTAKFVRRHRADRERHRRTLDTVRSRSGVRCGPLPSPRDIVA